MHVRSVQREENKKENLSIFLHLRVQDPRQATASARINLSREIHMTKSTEIEVGLSCRCSSFIVFPQYLTLNHITSEFRAPPSLPLILSLPYFTLNFSPPLLTFISVCLSLSFSLLYSSFSFDDFLLFVLAFGYSSFSHFCYYLFKSSRPMCFSFVWF